MDRPAFVTLEGYRPEMEAGLIAAAQADGHTVILPSHVICRAGELQGYLSLGAATFIMPWFDTRKMKSRDTIQIINTAENVLRVSGRAWALAPFPKDSPLHPMMTSLGYQNVGTYDLGLKKLL